MYSLHPWQFYKFTVVCEYFTDMAFLTKKLSFGDNLIVNTVKYSTISKRINIPFWHFKCTKYYSSFIRLWYEMNVSIRSDDSTMKNIFKWTTVGAGGISSLHHVVSQWCTQCNPSPYFIHNIVYIQLIMINVRAKAGRVVESNNIDTTRTKQPTYHFPQRQIDHVSWSPFHHKRIPSIVELLEEWFGTVGTCILVVENIQPL